MTSKSLFPKRVNAVAETKRQKGVMHAACLAHLAAMRDCDAPAADAAKSRFLTASDETKGRNRNG